MQTLSKDIFQTKSKEEIVELLQNAVIQRNESPLWRDKVAPFSSAILSVLLPLKEQGLLFNPEGEQEEELTLELFLRWCDFVSLKMLYFTLKNSNDANKLLRTKLDDIQKYEKIELEELKKYLERYSVNTDNEIYDFPIANYNLHLGVANVIKSLF